MLICDLTIFFIYSSILCALTLYGTRLSSHALPPSVIFFKANVTQVSKILWPFNLRTFLPALNFAAFFACNFYAFCNNQLSVSVFVFISQIQLFFRLDIFPLILFSYSFSSSLFLLIMFRSFLISYVGLVVS